MSTNDIIAWVVNGGIAFLCLLILTAIGFIIAMIAFERKQRDDR